MSSIQDHLRITEIFYSLQGEAKSAGYPTVFIRLTGCPLRCTYCDSEYAFEGGERMTLSSIIKQVESFGVHHICVTGGEPLAQPACITLLHALCNSDYSVSIETSGAMDISKIDSRVSVVMDLKTPDSGELDKNRWSNLEYLAQKDQVKFVVCSRTDFDWACFKLNEHQLIDKVGEVFFSPSYEHIKPSTLASWLLESKLSVRMQLQVHKLLWGDKPGV